MKPLRSLVITTLLVGGLLPAVASTASAAGPAGVVNACGTAAPGFARCLAQVRTDLRGGKGIRGPLAAAALPAGYGPADLKSAYALPGTDGATQTVGIVDAGDSPTVEADLAVYRSTFGLPPCTTDNGCFRKVNQRGAASPLPPQLFGWPTEIALDVDMVSAACPLCHIVLVEGDSPSVVSLATAVDTAAALGANEISNSYGATEQNGMQAFEADYNHPGVAMVASSGDSGYGIPIFPAVFGNVIAAGGTSLVPANNTRGWAETAWIGAGSGCSAWIDKPVWQHDPNCPGRMTADVSAVADPRTGLAVYETAENGGWLVVGGTSASSPFIAGVIAQAGHPGLFGDASRLYANATALHDVVGGTNNTGIDCGGDYQCTGVAGYDGPTGNGTPNGLAAF